MKGEEVFRAGCEGLGEAGEGGGDLAEAEVAVGVGLEVVGAVGVGD